MTPQPDPHGDKSDDWTDPQWAVYVSLHAGNTRRQTAAETGVPTGTISMWVASWRKEHGDDLFRSQAVANTASAQARLAANTTPRKAYKPKEWVDPIEALDHMTQAGRLGEQARLIVSTMLDRIAADENRLNIAAIDDVRYLTQVQRQLADTQVVLRTLATEPEVQDDAEDVAGKILSLVEQLEADPRSDVG